MLDRRVLLAPFLCPLASTADAEDWREATKQRQLSSDQIQELAQNKILFTNRRVFQVFSPYIEPRMPVFITSDSILNAYHVLLEESVLRLELANSAKLPGLLRFLWQHLEAAFPNVRGDPRVVAAAKTRAQLVLGTAIKLLGDAALPTDARTAALISEEVGRVTAAEAVGRPEWLGARIDPQLLEIDYSRYRPRGFYDRTEGLSRYFRAVSWLQSIPFRVDDDEQLLAIILLAGGLAEALPAGDDAEGQGYAAFFECFRELLGDRDDWDLTTAASVARPGLNLDLASGSLEKIRRTLINKAQVTGHQPLISDQITTQSGQLPLSLRVLAAHRTPDAVLFGRTTGIDRPFPSGLEVGIALGSKYAEHRFEDPAKEGVLATIENSAGLFGGSSLYSEYLDCISALLDAPPPNAPAFMSRQPWQAKSCQTALAGWAQLRHTWTLQAKENIVVSLEEEWQPPVGFVEPDPVFFGRLKDLARRTGRLLNRAGTTVNADLYAIGRLQNLLRVLEAKAAAGEVLGVGARTGDRIVDYALYDVMKDLPHKLDAQAAKEFLDQAITKTRDLLGQIQRGERSGEEFAGGDRWRWERPVTELWEALATVSARLRLLAEKQLANQRFDGEDRDFIVTYGRHLAPLMFHSPAPSAIPRDDVPRIVDIVFNPSRAEYLEVGVGRPQIIYVLYPTEKGEVLCCGAVLPYYEFRSPHRLNDVQWKQLLDSSAAPAQPEWITSWPTESETPAQPERVISPPARSAPPARPERVTAPEADPWAQRVAILAGVAAAIMIAVWGLGTFRGRR